ncbi:reverse transcriptase domain-containing protein [Sporosarcina sp. D27]|uniref:reverse transcriptase domain-containing protein n=1 Tax=Sporosarcina sp. D27 TaxID=1382305 RepID=UPI00047267BB|nr:reverse transcriptase domain-containing protein [Sporosarcina sp. D27]
MMNSNTAELSYLYIKRMSLSKKHNPQSLANNKIFEEKSKKEILDILDLDVNEFCDLYQPTKCRDFIYKNDYLTPRNMYLINPLYYMKYTKIVFDIAKQYIGMHENELNFSKSKISVFYSGLFSINSSKESIDNNAMFNKSYSKFQLERKKYFGKHVLKIDIQNFFDSIKNDILFEKLGRVLGSNSSIDELKYILNSCGFVTLPQFHYSIASSLLSQLFLQDFDCKINQILESQNLQLIRFVDDMYIVYPSDSVEKKSINELMNNISFFLWEDELCLNNLKTEILSPEEYRANFDVEEEYLDYEKSTYLAEKAIEEKTIEVICTGKISLYFEKLCHIKKENGIDLKKYHELSNEYLATENGDVSKVINAIIFSGRWKALSDNDLLKLVNDWNYIFFNPSQFTILFIMVCRHLEFKKVISGTQIKSLLSYLFTNKSFTFRDALVSITYLIQNKKKNKTILNQLDGINPQYVHYITTYI